MIICCYTEFIRDWGYEEIQQKTALLPAAINKKIQQKKQLKDAQLSISGYLLLVQVLKELGLPSALSGLRYDSYHRPFLNIDFDFNITHSGNMVVCCGTTNTKIGADIELIKPINFDNYPDYFTENEWRIILTSDDRLNTFFKFWTRKKAVLKAAGTGFFSPLTDIDVGNDEVHFSDKVYYLSAVKINADYECHIACSVKQDIYLIQSAL